MVIFPKKVPLKRIKGSKNWLTTCRKYKGIFIAFSLKELYHFWKFVDLPSVNFFPRHREPDRFPVFVHGDIGIPAQPVSQNKHGVRKMVKKRFINNERNFTELHQSSNHFRKFMQCYLLLNRIRAMQNASELRLDVNFSQRDFQQTASHLHLGWKCKTHLKRSFCFGQSSFQSFFHFNKCVGFSDLIFNFMLNFRFPECDITDTFPKIFACFLLSAESELVPVLH